jgi:hypothetical protein
LLKSTCDVNLLSKLSIIFKEWRVMNNVDRGGVIVLKIMEQRPPKGARPIVFKEWRDTRTFSNLKSTHGIVLD